MCCRIDVYPLHLQVAVGILSIGLFTPTYWKPADSIYAVIWERQIPEEAVTVTASLKEGSLNLSLSPAISAFADHAGKRIAGGVYFEIAAKYAEKVGGEIIQKATVAGCKLGRDSQELLLGRYPSLPMNFERVCAGFQVVFLGDYRE